MPNAHKMEPEFELWDTGVLAEDRYFDITIEYAKATEDDHPDSRHGHQSRTGSSLAAPAADALVSQYLELGTRRVAGRICASGAIIPTPWR